MFDRSSESAVRIRAELLRGAIYAARLDRVIRPAMAKPVRMEMLRQIAHGERRAIARAKLAAR